MNANSPKQRLVGIDREHLWHPFTQFRVWSADEPLIVERGHGVKLVDMNGREYLDGISSLWCNVHGHGVPELVQAVKEQAEKICHSTLLGLSHRPVLELTEELLAAAPAHFSRVFFSDSGSAAVEAALRMAVEWWQKQSPGGGCRKKAVVSLENAYHGDTLGSVSLGYCEEFHGKVRSLLTPALKVSPPHVYRFYRGLTPEDALAASVEEVETLFRERGEEIAAFFLEPLVQGAAGMWIQPVDYGRRISELCRKHDILLVADEVATGFGKTGKLFAVEHAPIAADLLVIGKGLTGGYLPMSAVLTTEKIFSGFIGEPEEWKTFFFGQTFAGNPLACAVAAASLRLFKEQKIMRRLPEKIDLFTRGLQEKIAPLPHVDEVRSCGLMAGIEFTAEKGCRRPYPPNALAGQRVVREARKRGVIIRPLGNVMVLMPALAMESEDLQLLLDVTAESIEAGLNK